MPGMTEMIRKPFMPPSGAQIRKAGINTLMRCALAHLVAKIDSGTPAQVADRMFPNDRDVALLIRAPVVPTSTTNTPALMTTLTAYLVAALTPAWAGATFLEQTLQLEFGGNTVISVPTFVADANDAGFVGQGQPIPARSLLVTPCLLLEPFAIKTISTMSIEMITGSGGNAQKMVEDVLTRDVGLRLDSVFDENPAIPDLRPAGLRNGIAPLTASRDAYADNAMRFDVAKVVGAVSAVAGNTLPILAASPARANTLRLFGSDGIRAMMILGSSAIADGDLLALAPNGVVSAMDNAPQLSASFETAVHQDSAPTNIGTAGTPTVVAQPVISMFQTGNVALKCRLEATWARRDDRAVAWLTATGW